MNIENILYPIAIIEHPIFSRTPGDVTEAIITLALKI